MGKYIKGMYIIWPDYDYIEQAIDAGINTLMIAWDNLYPHHDNFHNHWGHYETTINLLDRYSTDKRVNIVLVPTLNLHFADKPEKDCFFDGTKYLRRTPCPTSKEWIFNRLLMVKVLCDRYNIKDVIWDVEHYGHKTNPNVVKIWEGKKPEHKCKCEKCKKFSTKQQWLIFSYNFKKFLKKFDLDSSGQLNYFNLWNFSKYTGEKWIFTEKTYPLGEPGNKSTIKKYFKRHWEKLLKYRFFDRDKLKICPGIWVENFKSNDLLDYIYDYGKISLYSGYWLYTHARFSKNTRFKRDHHDARYGKQYYTLIDNEDPDFFKKLKKTNKKIDKYRGSWKFKFKNLIKI